LEPERDPGEYPDFGVGGFDESLGEAVIEVGVDGFALALSSTWTPSTTVAVNPHPGSNTLLLSTLFCSPWLRALRQGKRT
jgi:hypothetical protein